MMDRVLVVPPVLGWPSMGTRIKGVSMRDSSKPANLCLPVSMTLVLALSVALTMLAGCGSPPGDAPAATTPGPAGVEPTPATAQATVPVPEEAALVGTWADTSGLTLVLDGSGVYTLSTRRRELGTGAWSIQKDGSLDLERQPGVIVPHGNMLLQDRSDRTATVGILQRVDDEGNLVAYEPTSAIEVPPVDASAIQSITIADNWTGFSDLAPIEAHFHLEPSADGFSGRAEFSVAGYTEALTTTAPISIPQAVIDELLVLLESTPLEVGEYKPLFSHTDDFPDILIAVEGKAGALKFASRSQGSRNIPWHVVAGKEQYVTYSDTPAQALELLDPYLAREVQEELSNLALEREQ
jgi:hypothetical protein